MAKQNDSLRLVEGPDRVHYQTGVLLNAEDFIAEQNYHRGRLARALGYLNGEGTLAGLRVEYEEAQAAVDDLPESEERIKVTPGLAIDRFGRLIEIPETLCLRIGRWYRQQEQDNAAVLIQSWHEADDLWTGSVAGVVVDVFVSFLACERGKTPSFAQGPFDSIDAVTAARLRDAYQVELVLRGEANPPLPQSGWQDLSALSQEERSGRVKDLIFDAWREDGNFDGSGRLAKKVEHTADQDPTAVFLARMIIPADQPVGDGLPLRREDEALQVRNEFRLFVITCNHLLQLLGIDLDANTD